jgi:glycosyltransferase involved in cell wall biosynthesis
MYAYMSKDPGLKITALYLSDYSIRGELDRAFGEVIKWDIDLLTGYDARFVEGASTRAQPTGFWSILAPQIWREVREGRFDALVVHGHTPAAHLLAVLAAKAAETPVFMRGETHLGLTRPWWKRALRRIAMGGLYRLVDGVLAIGSANADFYRAMGVPEGRIFRMPYTVDNNRFMAASRLDSDDRCAVRESLGVTDGGPIILYAAKLQRRKRPEDLLLAAARLSADGASFHLLMVGSGELESDLRRRAEELNLRNIHFVGFVNQQRMPAVYAASDVFVLPSEDEPWGLAVNEAMCAGLPIVVAAQVGCADDLVIDGVNGRSYAAGDVEALAAALKPIISDPETRRAMGAASAQIISKWSYAECVAGLHSALASVAGVDAR